MTRVARRHVLLLGVACILWGGGGGLCSCAHTAGEPEVLSELGTLAIDSLSARVAAMPGDGPVLLASFDVERDPQLALEFDLTSAEAAHVYDNALVVIALVAGRRLDAARRVADGLVYARHHDRDLRDGRLRNAYAAGILGGGRAGAAGSGADAPMRPPGFWSPKTQGWAEDGYAYCSAAGNVAWAALALLALDEVLPDRGYGREAVELGRWLLACCRDERGAGGFRGGYEGYDGSWPMTWKSTEHNIDLVALFAWLHAETGEPAFAEAQEHAKAFVLAMWDAEQEAFRVGTLVDGATPLPGAAALDPQTWSSLVLGESVPETLVALGSVERAFGVALEDGVAGFDFDGDRDGIWVEGTAQAILALRRAGRAQEVERYVAALEQARAPRQAGFFATLAPRITTGLPVSGTGVTFYYYRRPHLGATAWVALAALDWNPFAPGGRDVRLAAPQRRVMNPGVTR